MIASRRSLVLAFMAAFLAVVPAAARNTGLIFVSNEKSNNVIVLDPKTYKVVKDIKTSRPARHAFQRRSHRTLRLGDLDRRQDGGAGGAACGFYKDLAVGVRPWDQQLGQAVFLSTPNAVVASAPIEGFLHRANTLDTLGDNEQETSCKLKR